MGDPKKRRKKYSTPNHPWQKERLDSEEPLIKAYGLKNKKELWRAQSALRSYRTQAKKVSSSTTEQAIVEQEHLLTRLRRLGMLKPESRLDDVLTLTLHDILERRLQTIVYRKGLSKSMDQARQFITHEHITIGNTKIKAPGHLVTVDEQAQLTFRANSTLADPEHPERTREKIVIDTSGEIVPEAEEIEQ
jgi:small subunit ribosomal protein S4